MAALLGESVGATVGYKVRLDSRVSAATRIEVVTEGAKWGRVGAVVPRWIRSGSGT